MRWFAVGMSASVAHTDSAMTAGWVPGVALGAAPAFPLLRAAVDAAERQGVALRVGPVFSSDTFYGDEPPTALARFGTLAVEMEGYGTLAATNIPKLDAIIVRAISDNVVDKAQCDGKGWQPLAAHYASAFAFELLANSQVGQGTLAQRGPQAAVAAGDHGRQAGQVGHVTLPGPREQR